jgi:bacillithiol system protein YtxJ
VQELTTVEQIDEVLAASDKGPVLVFKHSLTCGRSAFAEEEVLEFMRSAACPMPVYVVAVQSRRQISAAIEARFGVRHETPQVLLLRHGRVAWSTSHYNVTRAAIEKKCTEFRQDG